MEAACLHGDITPAWMRPPEGADMLKAAPEGIVEEHEAWADSTQRVTGRLATPLGHIKKTSFHLLDPKKLPDTAHNTRQPYRPYRNRDFVLEAKSAVSGWRFWGAKSLFLNRRRCPFWRSFT